MIDLEFLTAAFNEILGTDKFMVYLNTDVFNEDLGERNAVVMSVTRVPFGYKTEEFDAESALITFVFDLPVSIGGDELMTRDVALSVIADKLLGNKEYFISTPDGDYKLTCFFQQQAPTDPYADDGRVTQQITVSGTVLIQNDSCRAIVGNSVRVKIDGVELLKASHSSALQYGTDSNLPLSENTTLLNVESISRVCMKTLNFIYTGQDIEKTFLKMAEGIVEEDINTVHQYEVSYGNDVLIRMPFKLLSVSVVSETGVFVKYALTLQTVQENETENEAE